MNIPTPTSSPPPRTAATSNQDNNNKHPAIITQADIAALTEAGRLIVTMHHRTVYDVTTFATDHPGGEKIMRPYAGGKDVTSIMANGRVHCHSEAAYSILEGCRIGVLPAAATDGDDEGDHEVPTDLEADFAENHFLDLNKPLLWQVLRNGGDWSREFYLEQVHKPRHYPNGSAPLLGGVLEPISLTPWWAVPLLHGPANLFMIIMAISGSVGNNNSTSSSSSSASRSSSTLSSSSSSLTLTLLRLLVIYVIGLAYWTLVEYGMHRCIFHLDDYLPANRIAYTMHFLLHGVHHYLPMDKYRLVMPPTLLFVLAVPQYYVEMYVLFPFDYHGNLAMFAGAHCGYICYDMCHYFTHHAHLPRFFKTMKKNHLDHHYKDFRQGYGVTSSFWDHVFGTQFVDTEALREQQQQQRTAKGL